MESMKSNNRISLIFQCSPSFEQPYNCLLVKLLQGEDNAVLYHRGHDEGHAGEEVLVVSRGGPAYFFLVSEEVDDHQEHDDKQRHTTRHNLVEHNDMFTL